MKKWLEYFLKNQPVYTNGLENQIYNQEIIKLTQTPEVKAATEALWEHFTDPKTYRDWVHDTNTFGTNVIRKTPGMIPNVIGGTYGWLFDKPDNWMTRTGKWIDKNVGDPLGAMNIAGQAIDRWTSESGDQKAKWFQMPDGQYSSALRAADPYNFMGFLEDMGSGAIATGGVSAASKIPAVAKYVTPTLKAPVEFFKAWNNLGKKAQNILPAAFNQTLWAANMNPAKAQAITKGLGILNKGLFKTLTWGAPAIDAFHNYLTRNTRFDRNNIASNLARTGYALKLLSPWQSSINAVANIPTINRGLTNLGAGIYNQHLDKPVGDAVEHVGKSTGERVVKEVKEGEPITSYEDLKALANKIPQYAKEELKKYTPVGDILWNVGTNVATNLEEGQYNSSDVAKQFLPGWLTHGPLAKIKSGFVNAVGDKIPEYLRRGASSFSGPIVDELPPELRKQLEDPETGKLMLKDWLLKNRVDPEGAYKVPLQMTADEVNKQLEPHINKLPEEYQFKVEPWHITTASSQLAKLTAYLAARKARNNSTQTPTQPQ